MRRHGQGDQGYLEIEGRLAQESVEKIDSDAIAVMVQGEPVGYLSFADSRGVDPRAFGSHTISVQAFSELVNDRLRVEAWAWLAPTRAEWEWSEHRRPPMTSAHKARQRQKDSREILNRRAASSPERAREIEKGTINGVHYLELAEPIKQAKREGRNEYALKLCFQAIEGAERGALGGMPAPGYTEHAAIILRKLKRRDEEIAVLDRYLRWIPWDDRQRHPFMERIRKVEAIQKKEKAK